MYRDADLGIDYDVRSTVSCFEGVTGRTSFDGHQDAVKRPTLVEIRGGAEHLIEER